MWRFLGTPINGFSARRLRSDRSQQNPPIPFHFHSAPLTSHLSLLLRVPSPHHMVAISCGSSSVLIGARHNPVLPASTGDSRIGIVHGPFGRDIIRLSARRVTSHLNMKGSSSPASVHGLRTFNHLLFFARSEQWKSGQRAIPFRSKHDQ